MTYIDLHMHSYASDGTDSPAQLIIKASELGLSTLALTDHDTISGLAEAEEQALKCKIEFIRGCELSALYEGEDIHILALWLPHSSDILEEKLAKIREYKKDRVLTILERLCKLGMPINYAEIVTHSNGKAITHIQLAQVMVKKGYAQNTKECFSKYLGTKGSVYEPKKSFDAKELISFLTNIGASVSLAHPCKRGSPYSKIEAIVREFTKHGLFALEAYHSGHSIKDQNFCIELAKKYKLTLTGGSDYHGLAKQGITLGRVQDNVPIPAMLLDALKEQRVKLGLYI